MGVFEPITLNWQGADYTIPGNKVMGAIARIEDVVTLTEIYEASQRKAIKLSRIASAYATALRYAGCDVADEDVYAGMFDGRTAETSMVEALNGLLMMMVPPNAMKSGAKGLPRGNARPAGVRSSKKPSH